MTGYSDSHVGSDIQDFKVKNAINKLADNFSNIAQLVSAGVAPQAIVATQQVLAASYVSVVSLAVDVLAIRTALKNSGILF